MSVIWITIAIMGGIGLLAAAVLYFVAKKFYVHEDERIAEVEAELPGANCGSCGYKGCHDFAVACCAATSLEDLYCPGAGSAGMEKIADILGLKPSGAHPQKAVVTCAGSCSMRPSVRRYDGVRRCSIEASFSEGESDCAYGCLGCGDCVSACPYDALHMDADTGLPVVNPDNCVGCGRCVDACPRGVMQLVPEPESGAQIMYVACRNKDKGAQAMKECQVSCIGCGKCKKVCEHEAVSLNGPLALIDPAKCVGCGECEQACPRHSIQTFKR